MNTERIKVWDLPVRVFHWLLFLLIVGATVTGKVGGGATLHYFAVALTVGICFGIYSSVLVASPLVMWLGVSRENFIKVSKQVEGANKDGAVV